MLMKPREDGITHINIYSKAQTPLGRGLSNWDYCPIETSMGKFLCIEGLIFFMGSFYSEFRDMTGYNAKKNGDKLDRGIRIPEEIFREKIIEAMWAKLYRSKPLLNLLKESTLPLVHYYNYSGKMVFAPKWDWQIQEWEKIRQELKNESKS